MNKERSIYEEAFNAHAFLNPAKPPYTRSRGLFTPEKNSYLDSLTKWEGKDLVELIDSMVQSSDYPVDLLDLGCGDSEFLLDSSKRWKRRINCTGVDANVDRLIKIGPWRSKLLGALELYLADVYSLKADLLYLPLPSNTYDFAVSAWVFEYLADPWVALQEAHRVLKPGGVGLISNFHFPAGIHGLATRFEGTKRSREQVKEYLQGNYGFNFEPIPEDFDIFKVSFKKNERKLFLPLEPVGAKMISFDNSTSGRLPGYPVISYRPKLGRY